MKNKKILELCLAHGLGGLEMFVASCYGAFSKQTTCKVVVAPNSKLDDYLEDVGNEVTIMVLKTDGDDYLYVPISYVKEDVASVIDNNKSFVYKSINIPLGYIPTDYDLTELKDIIVDTIYDEISLKTVPVINKLSDEVKIDKVKYDVFMKLLKNKNKADLSYKAKYYKALEKIELMTSIMKDLLDSKSSVGTP